MVEQSAVNRSVASSSLARGANRENNSRTNHPRLSHRGSLFLLYNNMNDNTSSIKKWSDTWHKADIALNSIKSIEMNKENYLCDSLISLTDVFNYSLANAEPSTTSGLVEMQKYFAKLRKK